MAGNVHWTPSQAALAAGRAARVRYDAAPYAANVEHLQQPITPGLRALRDHAISTWPYVRRTDMAGFHQSDEHLPAVQAQGPTARIDMHNAGRGCDLMLSMLGANPDLPRGSVIANWFVEHSFETGVQLVIFAGWCYTSGANGGRFDAYHGASAHDDHVHFEVNIAGGAKQLPWYRPTLLPSMDSIKSVATWATSNVGKVIVGSAATVLAGVAVYATYKHFRPW